MPIQQFWIGSSPLDVGQQAYTSPGSYSWTCPVGVYSISVVCVGTGGVSQPGAGGGGGGGGGLGYKNNISVTPGQSYTVVVGAHGTSTFNVQNSTGDSGDSYFINTSTVKGGGGKGRTFLNASTDTGGDYVGDGGGNNNQQWSSGGGGGALAWKNNISVTPGQSYTVEVGDQWPRASGNTPGETSYFINLTTCAAGGGWPDNSIWTPYNAPGGVIIAGDGGGDGGMGGSWNSAATMQPGHITTAYGGGGGAGGYSGMGGNGCSNDTAAPVQGSDGQGGGGGGGYAIQDFGQFSQGAFDTTHGGGGGVGIYGEGTSGVKGTNSSGNRGGKGGSAGANGIECLSYQGNSAPGSYGTGSGGQFGGGSGGGGDAGHGAVRLIWGTGRSFPSTNTQNQSGGGSISWTPTINDTGYYWLVCGSSLQPNHSGQPNPHSLQSEILIIVDPPACYDDSMASGGSSKAMLQVKNTRPDAGLMTEWCHKKGNRFGLGHAALQQEHRDNIKDRSIIGTGENFWPRQNTLNRGVPTGGSNGYQPQGDSIYTTPGNYQWICPTGVTSVCAVAIGGGGAGGPDGSSYTGGAAGGGGLGWKNSITVIPGNTYTVVVGAAAVGGTRGDGGDSYFINGTTVAGLGGKGTDMSSGSGNGEYGGYGGGHTGDGGGDGGRGGEANVGAYEGGGAGAGGYSGDGGHGGHGTGYQTPTEPYNRFGGDGTGGAGSGGAYGGGYVGGGTQIYGEGASGTGTELRSGMRGSDPDGTITSSYGGGGSGAGATGGGGAVRIMWGGGRSFPINAAALS